MNTCQLSVIIPIYNEEENIQELYSRLCKSLDPTRMDYELLFVNDHSRDRSLDMLKDIRNSDPRVRIVSLSRNFGHQAAVTAGLRFARGAQVIVMDGDLQDPPEVLPELIAARQEGQWDVLYAIRRKRKEGFLIRLLYHLFYRLLRKMARINIPADSGDFCIMSRRVVDSINNLPERIRFVRGLRAWVGFRQSGMEYERAARHAGKSKYSWRALLRLAADGILGFSYIPLRLCAYLGLGVFVVGLFYAFFLILGRLMGNYTAIPGWTTVMVVTVVMGGLQMMMIGVVGEYIGRIYEELKGRPVFVVEELLGFESDARQDG